MLRTSKSRTHSSHVVFVLSLQRPEKKAKSFKLTIPNNKTYVSTCLTYFIRWLLLILSWDFSIRKRLRHLMSKLQSRNCE